MCPKCRRELRHLGMDYGKPGTIVHCRGCGVTSPEPEPRFACLDCAAVIGTEQATAIDWFHYDLTEAGMLVLRNGRLPDEIDFREADGVLAPRPLKEFRLLATAALRSARRFARPFTLARLAPSNLSDLRRDYGLGRVEGALQQAAATIAEALSDTEFVGIADDALLIGLPETSAAQAAALVDVAVAAAISEAELKFDLDITFFEGDEAAALLGKN